MLQNYKIFSGNTEIIITSERPSECGFLIHTLLINELSEIDTVLVLIRKGGRIKKIFLVYPEPPIAFSYLKKKYKYLEAAGGLVRNLEGKILFIKKHDRWDLPKGLIKKKEGKKEAAIRETEEECGVSKLKIISVLDKTYHIGRSKGRKFLKKTYWYEMICEDEQKPRPERSEGIKKVKWVNPDSLEKYLEKSYANLQYLIRNYIKM